MLVCEKKFLMNKADEINSCFTFLKQQYHILNETINEISLKVNENDYYD